MLIQSQRTVRRSTESECDCSISIFKSYLHLVNKISNNDSKYRETMGFGEGKWIGDKYEDEH